jgi:hypothetical protein
MQVYPSVCLSICLPVCLSAGSALINVALSSESDPLARTKEGKAKGGCPPMIGIAAMTINWAAYFPI